MVLQADTPGPKPKNIAVHLNVDTAVYNSGYNGTSQSAFTLQKTVAARSVDVRPRQGKHQVENMSQLRPIKWDPERGIDAAAEFYKKPDPWSLSWEEVRPHAALMLERLRFQREHYFCNGPPPEWMVEQSLAKGPSFTNDYASSWKEGRFAWAKVERTEPVLETPVPVVFEDYNRTYLPFFFIFWEDETEDYLYMKQGEPTSDPELISAIQSYASDLSSKLLPDGDFSCPDHVIWAPSSSNAFDGERGKPEWELEFENPIGDEIANHLVYLRGQAMKRPSEVRDIGTLTPSSLRAHRRCMYPLQRACRRIPGCVYGQDQSYIANVVSDIGDSCRYFYMRDYTKSGMTMPKQVRSAILRGFFSRDPDLAEWAVRLFDKQMVHVRNKDRSWHRFQPDTGTPLGMFVEGFTLLQYIMHKIVTEHISGKFKFNGTNDDMIVGSLNKEALAEYATRDCLYQDGIGMLVKGTKTGLSENRFFYCEEYWDTDHIMSKEVLTSLALIGAKYAINVVHAKELVNAIIINLPYVSPIVELVVKEVSSSFDYEFTDQECNWPYLFGGWWPTYRDGLDTSIEWYHGDAVSDATYWACRQRPKHERKLKEEPTLAFGRIKFLRLRVHPDDVEYKQLLVPFFGTKNALRDLYCLRSRHPGDLARYYRETYIARQRTFIRIMNGKQECEHPLESWLIRHPNSVIHHWIPGVEVSKEGFVVDEPRIGLSTSSSEALLRTLRSLDYIDYPNPSEVSMSEKMITKLGLLSELSYQRMPVPYEGLSLACLRLQPRGLMDFHERTRLFVKRIHPEDDPLYISRWWFWMPKLPLITILRMSRWAHKISKDLDDDTAYFYNMVVMKQLAGSGYEPEPVEDDDVLGPVDQELEAYIRSLIGGATADLTRKMATTAFPTQVVTNNLPPELEVTPNSDGLIWLAEGSFIDPSQAQDGEGFWDQSPISEIGDWFES